MKKFIEKIIWNLKSVKRFQPKNWLKFRKEEIEEHETSIVLEDNDNIVCVKCNKEFEEPVLPFDINFGLFNRITDEMGSDGSNICINCFLKSCKQHYITKVNVSPENAIYRLKFKKYNFFLRIYGNHNTISWMLNEIATKDLETVVDVLEAVDEYKIIYDIINEKVIDYHYSKTIK